MPAASITAQANAVIRQQYLRFSAKNQITRGRREHTDLAEFPANRENKYPLGIVAVGERAIKRQIAVAVIGRRHRTDGQDVASQARLSSKEVARLCYTSIQSIINFLQNV